MLINIMLSLLQFKHLKHINQTSIKHGVFLMATASITSHNTYKYLIFKVT